MKQVGGRLQCIQNLITDFIISTPARIFLYVPTWIPYPVLFKFLMLAYCLALVFSMAPKESVNLLLLNAGSISIRGVCCWRPVPRLRATQL